MSGWLSSVIKPPARKRGGAHTHLVPFHVLHLGLVEQKVPQLVHRAGRGRVGAGVSGRHAAIAHRRQRARTWPAFHPFCSVTRILPSRS